MSLPNLTTLIPNCNQNSPIMSHFFVYHLFLNKEITLDSFNFLGKIPRVIAKFTNVESTKVSTEEESLIK